MALDNSAHAHNHYTAESGVPPTRMQTKIDWLIRSLLVLKKYHTDL